MVLADTLSIALKTYPQVIQLMLHYLRRLQILVEKLSSIVIIAELDLIASFSALSGGHAKHCLEHNVKHPSARC